MFAAPLLITVLAFSGQPNHHPSHREPQLVGFASLPADTFAPGPESGTDNGSGDPISANGRTGPFPGQPVQGFSGVQFSGKRGQYWFLSDNGFGSPENSADYLLRLYRMAPDFRVHRHHGDGDVDVKRFIQLRDPDELIPFAIVNEGNADRTLTGADFDIESFVFDRHGDLWIGDELGPYLLHFDRHGVLLEPPIPTPQVVDGELDFDQLVKSPYSPELELGETPNLSASRGFEGMAFSPNRRWAYPMLEGTVMGDPAGALRIYKFDLGCGEYRDFVGYFGLEVPNHAIGDFTPVNNSQFLVIERDGGQGEGAQFKKIFLIDISRVDADGYVKKTELVDLLDIADPRDLNEDGNDRFDFPFVTIEDVLVVDRRTLLVANDNNYPFSVGRGPDIDNNEIILVRLPKALRVDRRLLPR